MLKIPILDHENGILCFRDNEIFSPAFLIFRKDPKAFNSAILKYLEMK
jgi:hypothetical protein